jgi:hypothetical protein
LRDQINTIVREQPGIVENPPGWFENLKEQIKDLGTRIEETTATLKSAKK